MQFQADILGIPVRRPAALEVTALGAAALAGLATGFWSDRSELEAAVRAGRIFEPRMPAQERDALYAGWRRAVDRARAWETA
jgi:glycerol kinase